MIAKNTVPGRIKHVRGPQGFAPQAIHPYALKPSMMKEAITNRQSAIAGHTTPFRTPSVAATVSETRSTYPRQYFTGKKVGVEGVTIEGFT